MNLQRHTRQKNSFSFAPTIYSETVCLRQIDESDLSSILGAHCGEDVSKTISWESDRTYFDGDLTWASQDVATGEVYGTVTLIELSPTSAEIEFMFHCDRWKRHLCFESLKLVLDWAFKRFPHCRRIQVRSLPINIATTALLNNVGLRSEGVNRAASEVNGEVCDLACFAMTRHDWELRQGNQWSSPSYDFAHM